ncbi:MAG: glycosyl transferase family 2 [Frankiales bacterium]|nr:glycosyl transferase family 2 [Frankiales bacterium]
MISVVVPTRDRPTHLATCLEALRAELRADDELVVVDSASVVPVEQAAVRAARPGASLARNLGWQAATAEVVAFVDDDVQVATGWRAAVDAALDGVDAVCGRVAVPLAQQGIERPVAVTPDLPVQLLAFDGRLRGVSANLVVRRTALQVVGGFDERLGPGTWSRAGEDLELQDRLLRAGLAVRYDPSVLAFHDQWRSRRSLLRLDYGYGVGAGARASWLGGATGRAVLREALWENGIRPVGHDLRVGYQFGALTGLVRAAGTVVGAVRGWRRR